MFLHVTHANGQTSEIPVTLGEHTFKVVDAFGAVTAAVAFANVADFSLSPTSLYEVAEELAVEEVPVPLEVETLVDALTENSEPDAPAEEVPVAVEPAPEPAPAVEPVAPAEPKPVVKPRRSFGKK